MQEQYTLQILELLHTMQEACLELYDSAENGKTEQFQQLCRDGETGLMSILNLINGIESDGNKKLKPACRSILDSLWRIMEYYQLDLVYCLKKIEFELLPLLQQAYLSYYFFQYLADHPEHLNEYYTKEKNLLCGNSYIDEAIERGQYKYDLSIIVTGYNKLQYTKQCIESLLENIPIGLNYELILVNHGSSDGTKEYFETVHPHKQLDIAVNGGGCEAVNRIVEGEFTLSVSNDVIITPYAIENLLACICSDEQIAWAVPATSNVSNFQTIPAQYESKEELMEFARKNNQKSVFRCEQRVRLCNPVDICRNKIFFSTSGLGIPGHYYTLCPDYATAAFPDDRNSLLLRRAGYKLMLVKNAYCHHFGSITLKEEIQKKNEQSFYLEGRRKFYQRFGVDPWGLGCCYDVAFINRVVGEDEGHIEILGVNCGLGSNSLRIKEQLKEYCHNLDIYLSNITDDSSFLEDLAGISNEAHVICRLKELKNYVSEKRYNYIVFENYYSPQVSANKVLEVLYDTLHTGGRMFLKLNGKHALVSFSTGKWMDLGYGWMVLEKRKTS